MNKIIDRLKTIWACALTLIVFRHPSTKLTFSIRVPFCIQRYNGLVISWPNYTKQSTKELTRQAKTFFPVTQFPVLCTRQPSRSIIPAARTGITTSGVVSDRAFSRRRSSRVRRTRDQFQVRRCNSHLIAASDNVGTVKRSRYPNKLKLSFT